MAKDIPFIFCRYGFLFKKKPVSEDDQHALLKSLVGIKIGYRVRDPSPDDLDTFEMNLRHFKFDEVGVLTWCVGYDVKMREQADYDADADEIDEHLAPAEGVKYARFVAVPSLSVVAISDQHGDTHLGGTAAISRFKSVVRSKKGNRVRIELAGSSADIDRAFKNWKVSQFAFSVRPFNPTRRRLGGQLHDLMVKNGVGQLSGVAKPTAGDSLDGPKKGIVGEAIGLADHGYGQVALKGVTEEGREATIGKPHFSQEKEQNKKKTSKSEAP